MGDRAVADWLRRADDAARELADMAPDLEAFRLPGGGPGDGSGVRVSSVHAALPFRADVCDLLGELVSEGERLVKGVCAAAGPQDNPRAGEDPFVWTAARLPQLHAADPGVAADAVGTIWRLHHAVARIVAPEKVRMPRRIDDRCPGCGLLSLWLDPRGAVATWQVACGLPSCGTTWKVSEPLYPETKAAKLKES